MGCLECIEACVYKQGKYPNEFNLGLGKRKPIYIPFPQAVPPIRCSSTRRPASSSRAASARRPAWRSAATARPSTSRSRRGDRKLEVGTIILATGFKPFDPRRHSPVRLRQLTPTSTPPGSRAAGQRLGPDAAARWSCATARKPKSVGIIHCVGSPRREHQQVLLARLLHVLAEAGAPDQGADRAPRSTTSTSTCAPPGKATRSSTTARWRRASLHPRQGGRGHRLGRRRPRRRASWSCASRTRC